MLYKYNCFVLHVVNIISVFLYIFSNISVNNSNTVGHYYRNADTYAHIARWGCKIAVGRNASSLSLSSLCGYWGQEHNDPSSDLSSPPTSSLFYIYHSPFHSPVFSSPLSSFGLLSFSPHPLSFPPLLSSTPTLGYPFFQLLSVCGTAQHVMA